MLLFVGWIILSVFVGWAASTRGRNGLGWFLISCLISPLLGVLVLIAVPPLSSNSQAENDDRSIEDQTKKCPRCAEIVKAEAKVCRFCGHDFELQERVSAIEPSSQMDRDDAMPEAATTAQNSTVESPAGTKGNKFALAFLAVLAAFIAITLVGRRPHQTTANSPFIVHVGPITRMPETAAQSGGAQAFQPCHVIAVGSLTALSDHEIRGALCGAARATVDAITTDDKVAIDECYAAAGNLMIEFKRRFRGEDPKAGC